MVVEKVCKKLTRGLSLDLRDMIIFTLNHTHLGMMGEQK
jgi:hypothetical protein